MLCVAAQTLSGLAKSSEIRRTTLQASAERLIHSLGDKMTEESSNSIRMLVVAKLSGVHYV